MPTQAPPSLTYDVVIATKDRPHLIPFSLRSLFEQTIAPQRIIMVDASREHDEVVRRAEQCRREYDVNTELEVLQSHPSKAAQCNRGLQRVESPIVMIPDDDSVFLPDAAEHVLRVYERDTDEVIGGVELTETRQPPPLVASAEAQASRKASFTDRLVYRFAWLKIGLLNRIARDPFHIAAGEMLAEKTIPPWLDEVDAEPVPFVIGFRMTFRTDVVRRCGMNEAVVHGVRYDDFDLSLNVMKSHLLARTRKGFVYHHRAGGARDVGLRTGISLLLNRCYIVCLHTPPGSAARRAVRWYARRLMVDYGLRAHTRFGRERLRGIRHAARWVPYLLDSPADELTERYKLAWSESHPPSSEKYAGERTE